MAGEARSQPEPCTERCDEHLFLSRAAEPYVSSAVSWTSMTFSSRRLMLASLEPEALLAWCVLVLRHAQRTGLKRTSRARRSLVSARGGGGGGWSGGLGVDSVRDGVLPDPLALSEVVGLPESKLRLAFAALYRISRRCLRFSSSTWWWSSSWTRFLTFPLCCHVRCYGGGLQLLFFDKVVVHAEADLHGLVVQKTAEITQLHYIDKVLPFVVAQKQIPMVLTGVTRQCRKLWSIRSCTSSFRESSSWTRLLTCPLLFRSGCRKTVEYPQLQVIGKVVEVPVIIQRQVYGDSQYMAVGGHFRRY